MGAGLSKLLILALVLASFGLFASIAAAQAVPEGMWHKADEIGPGTFKPGNYIFPPNSAITGNASIEIHNTTILPNPPYPTEYEHNILKFPASRTVGLYLDTYNLPIKTQSSNGAGASFSSVYNPAALFFAGTAPITGRAVIEVYNTFTGSGGAGKSISATGDVSIKGNVYLEGDILPTINSQYGSGYDIGARDKQWNTTYTQTLCLSGSCKNAWPTGGGGGGGATPDLQAVTDAGRTTTRIIESFGLKTDTGIETGGLTLGTSMITSNTGVIQSRSGNVIIRLGNPISQ